MTTSLEVRTEKPSAFDRGASPALTLDMGLIVPVQFYDLIRRSAFLDGETRLVFAVLEDAIRTYLSHRDSRRGSGQSEFAEVVRWFEESTGSVPFSFEYVCEVLELEPESFRRQVRILQRHSLPTKQMRSAGRRHRVRTTRYVEKRSSWEA